MVRHDAVDFPLRLANRSRELLDGVIARRAAWRVPGRAIAGDCLVLGE